MSMDGAEVIEFVDIRLVMESCVVRTPSISDIGLRGGKALLN